MSRSAVSNHSERTHDSESLRNAEQRAENAERRVEQLEQRLELLEESKSLQPAQAQQAQNRAERTLERAKRELGVESIRSGFGPGSIVSWGLPVATRPAAPG